jgi:hypothetical protein
MNHRGTEKKKEDETASIAERKEQEKFILIN